MESYILATHLSTLNVGMHTAENGFRKDGDRERMIADVETRLDGRLPIDTDGGRLACGEPR